MLGELVFNQQGSKDIALASHVLRRVTAARPTDRPRLDSTQRQGFAVGVALMDVRRLTDGDMHAIAAAVARGSERVRRATDPASADALARELRLEPWRARAWRAQSQSGRTIEAAFSLVELMMLGGVPPGTDLDAGGLAGGYD